MSSEQSHDERIIMIPLSHITELAGHPSSVGLAAAWFLSTTPSPGNKTMSGRPMETHPSGLREDTEDAWWSNYYEKVARDLALYAQGIIQGGGAAVPSISAGVPRVEAATMTPQELAAKATVTLTYPLAHLLDGSGSLSYKM